MHLDSDPHKVMAATIGAVSEEKLDEANKLATVAARRLDSPNDREAVIANAKLETLFDLAVATFNADKNEEQGSKLAALFGVKADGRPDPKAKKRKKDKADGASDRTYSTSEIARARHDHRVMAPARGIVDAADIEADFLKSHPEIAAQLEADKP